MCIAYQGGLDTLKISKTSPIDIPDSAKIIEQSKTGYEQIKYTWSENGYKFEARWHTRTLGAPVEQGDAWVITRTTPGTASGQQKVQHILTGDGEWTTMSDWQAAVKARQKGTATTAQQQLLDSGHRPAN